MELRNLGKTFPEIGKLLGRSQVAVRVHLKREEGVQTSSTPITTSSVEEDQELSDSVVWKDRFQELNRRYQKALKNNSVTNVLVQDIKEVAPLSYSPLPAVTSWTPRSDSAAQSAVLMFSDQHVGKFVSPSQTLGFGGYDFDIFLARLKYLEESVLSIVHKHTTAHVDELVVAMLGDTLDGNLSHAAEMGQHSTLFSQFFGAGHAIAQFFRNLAPHFPKMRIQTAVGNHTRWSNQKKMPTQNRFSNLDMFTYALVQALTADIKNIEWSLNEQPVSVFDVKGFSFMAMHGDTLRGGDKSLGVPNHAFGRQVSVTAQLFAKRGQRPPNYYLTGHLHRGISLPHASGEILVNGGFPGIDGYGLAENFAPVDPIQRLLFVHPKFGRTSEYPLSLRFAKVTNPLPYIIPGSFI